MPLFREPAFHFFLLGAAIFALYAWLNPADPGASDSETIVLDLQDAERLSAQFKATWQRPPTAEELDGLLDALVREEVMVREATALGLDRGDGVIRNRLAQKMDFLTTSVAQTMDPDDEVLRRHMEENPERFTAPARLAFEQVGFGETPDPAALDAARDALQAGADPAGVGRRSLLPEALPMSPQQAIDGTFGQGFFDALEVLPDGAWSGPVRSGYGEHLVRITARQPASLPPFEQVRDAVLFDWRREMTRELTEAQYDGLRAQYEVVLPDLANLPEGTLR